MNKRLPTRKSLSQLNDLDSGLSDECLVMEGLPNKATLVTNGILSVPPGSGLSHLVSRGSDVSYDSARKLGKLDSENLSGPESPPDS